MARNEAKSLTRTDALRCYALRDRLSALPEGEVVTLTYVKRPDKNGVEVVSSSTGTVGTFKGEDGTDKMSVDLHTETKGTRTINLVRVTEIG